MLPLKATCPFRFCLGHIPICVDDVFALGVLGTTIKSCLVAPVYILYQDLFGFIEGLVFGIACYFCVGYYCYNEGKSYSRY